MTGNPFINTTSGLSPNAGVVGAPGAITATSTTSQTISTGVMSFQVPTQAAWAPGMFVSIVDSANTSNYMFGVVISYSGTTLAINVQSTNGSGTYATWQINIGGGSGPAGATGATGATGAAGANGGSIVGSAKGLKVTNHAATPSTKIDITAVSANLVTSTGTPYFAVSPSVTVDLTTGTGTSAANGMDGEARGTSAWIYLYLIYNGSAVAGLATLTSPLSGGPGMPTGYTYSCYVGAMYVDSSGNLMRTLQLGEHTQYVVTAATNTIALPLMQSGIHGNAQGAAIWVAVPVGAFVPPTTLRAHVCMTNSYNGTVNNRNFAVAPNNSYSHAESTNPPPLILGANSDTIIQGSVLLESTNVYYGCDEAGAALFCIGWEDYAVIA